MCITDINKQAKTIDAELCLEMCLFILALAISWHNRGKYPQTFHIFEQCMVPYRINPILFKLYRSKHFSCVRKIPGAVAII